MAHYFDHAASAPLREVARAAWLEASTVGANASSLHGSGRRARALVENARESAAATLDAHPTQLLWTGGGTESNNAGLKGLFWARNHTAARPRVLVGATEHHSVLDSAQWLARHHGADLVTLGVDRTGVIDLAAVEHELAHHHEQTALVAVMWVNNEVGTIQPIKRVVDLAHTYGVPVHVDAVQAIGALDVSLRELGATSAALSSHKWGGPTGVGLWWLARDVGVEPLLHGGGQERMVRSGTLDAAGAHAAAVALDAACGAGDATRERLRDYQARLIDAVDVIDGAHRTGPNPGPDLAPGIVHYVFAGARAEPLLFVLDSLGIHASNGAACTAGVVQPSHVVAAMGYNELEAQSTLRLSMGHSTTQADVTAVIAALPRAVAQARAAS